MVRDEGESAKSLERPEGVRELIRALPGFERVEVTLDSEFAALGLDSLDRLELLVEIEERWSVGLPDEHLFTPRVRDVVGALCSDTS